jgi:hypothetical protein
MLRPDPAVDTLDSGSESVSWRGQHTVSFFDRPELEPGTSPILGRFSIMRRT